MSEQPFMGAVAAVALCEAEEISAEFKCAFERSLQDGKHGVLVEQAPVGNGSRPTITPSHPGVPYGTVCYRPASAGK